MPYMRYAEMRVSGDCTRVLVPPYLYEYFLVFSIDLHSAPSFFSLLASSDDYVKHREWAPALP
jgi:hypothetical protein